MIFTEAMTDAAVASLHEITRRVGETFPTFGGGKGSDWNPIAAALKDKPLQFAAGVDVEEVVKFIVTATMLVVDESLSQALANIEAMVPPDSPRED